MLINKSEWLGRVPVGTHGADLNGRVGIRGGGLRMVFQALKLSALALLLSGPWIGLQAQSVAVPPKRTVNDWLNRMHDASRQRDYTGTLVVSTGMAMSASRIWHVCDGEHQMERIETLTGAPRTTIRRNNDVITFAPDEKRAWVEKRESLGLFPELLRTPANVIPEFYDVRETGRERVAGYLSDAVEIVPRDSLRFGYRIWAERESGLVVKLQTIDLKGQILEQLAFSELKLDAPVRMDKLKKQMKDTRGYEVFHPAFVKTSAEAAGWTVKAMVAGFQLMSCHTRARPDPSLGQVDAMQCVFSDGLASVSLFIEPLETDQPGAEGRSSTGATHLLRRHLATHWVTAMGEVPMETLVRMSEALERSR
ncbi:MucB/RseB C-terminal domain-containing protein [Hydrogenophaga sp. PAMC20947]|uniref:MucB/RseB C-terminal domain-containing protein n=1 Tax=Hydrogenophaga sp. PAMC20947 TaxID=2565558 RepID=UPI00109D9ED7|nr:MucB/RseB C-terminal domain-containing protein [Hydrogenophaga sp. PAMC20947]QCB44728.1 transcriptional regulator [Hydrogenophaga sp. PAMC20947]